MDDIRDRGPASADAVLGRVRAQCPDAAGPLRELAGVRFAERRWSDAADLAAAAVARDPTDQYAWEVLASSRFMLGDESDALRAWNAIGQPRVDDVQIHGLSRTRYALIAEALGLTTGEVLTSERLRRARRKLELLPDQSLARVGYRPAADGFATVDVTMMERPTRPIGIAGWVMNGARTAIERELDVAVPGGTGQGELWTGSWRWWEARPRAALAFTTPRFGGLPGVWRVDASWEAQSYRPDPDAARVREVRTHGGLTMSDWLTADLRYELRAGLDAWSGGRRAVSVGGTLERRFLGDDAAVTADVDRFVGAGVSFQAAGVHARFRSSSSAEGFVYLAGGGIETASDAAPFALWPGAGDGHGRSPLVRAHSLLEDGVVTGAVFGRRLVDGSTELQRWFETRLPIRVGAAVFIDMARASRRPSADATAWVVDAGGGFRAKVPGLRGVLRIDYARGLRDGAHALTFGWQY